MNRIEKTCIFAITLITFITLITTTSASIITVDDDLMDCPSANYTSIQPAINNATDGDVILVYAGTYTENVVVNKMLNITGIGEPIIDGMNNGNTVKIEADNCTIRNFEIKNSASDWNIAGIYIASNNNIIFNNIISSNGRNGIFIDSNNNTISFNTITLNKEGVYIYHSSENKILSNSILSNDITGIDLYSSNNNIVHSNEIKNNGYGFYHYASSSNTIYSNIISSNSADAFYIWSSGGNKIYDNEISGSNKGFEIWIYSSGNSIYENNVTDNNKGVYIYYPGYASNNNLFYHNNFIENSENDTWDECSNNWFNASLEEGNYYDDYEGTDADEDGIGDMPYNISAGDNQDLYPLMEPYVEEENKPPVAYFTYSPENPVVNETIIFNASLSYDTDGNITAYEWEFGDGANGTGEIVNHSYSLAGNYTVNLTVTDDNGAKNSTSEIVEVVEKTIFDTGEPENPYPSIFGTHNGTIIPNQTITVSTLYTYPCSGTGGHTEYARIWNSSWEGMEAHWNGYKGDWHNIIFDASFTLQANLTYNYTIKTGSYPQIHHTDRLETDNGVITCTKFADANGKRYDDWIPAVRFGR